MISAFEELHQRLHHGWQNNVLLLGLIYSRSSGYFSQQDFYTEDDAMESANLLDVMVEDKAKFQSSYTQGETSMELFLDHKNPWNKSIHPALPKIIQEHLQENRKRGECRNILVVFKRLKW